MESVVESPSTELTREIQMRYIILTRVVAELEAYASIREGSMSRLVKFRRPFIELVTLASFNDKFSEDVSRVYKVYQAAMSKPAIGGSRKYIAQIKITLKAWAIVSKALKDSKLIVLSGE